MSTEMDYFPRGSSTTKTEAKPEKARLNRVDRDDLFVSTSTKRKRSQHDAQKLKEERQKKKKKALDGEDRQGALYRRLHKQVRYLFSLKSSLYPLVSLSESYRWCTPLWLYRKNHSV